MSDKNLNGRFAVYKHYFKRDGSGGNNSSLEDTSDDLTEAKAMADKLYEASLLDTYEVLTGVVVQDASNNVYYERSVRK